MDGAGRMADWAGWRRVGAASRKRLSGELRRRRRFRAFLRAATVRSYGLTPAPAPRRGASPGLRVDPHEINIHVGQAVIPGQINRPAAPGGQIDHEVKRVLFGERKRGMAAHFDVVAIVDGVRPGDFAAVGVEGFEPGRGDSELAHVNWIMHSIEGGFFDGLAGRALVPAMRGNHVGVESVRLAGTFAAVSFNDVQFIARGSGAQEPEGRPGANGVGTDKPAFKAAGRLADKADAVLL